MRIRISPIRLVPLAMVFGLVAIYAGPARAADTVDAKVPFGFTAGSGSLPAGEYRLTVDWIGRDVTVQDAKSGKSVVAKFITTLAADPHPVSPDGRLVFDKPEDAGYSLSEVWLPGLDGVLVGAAQGKHTHSVVNVKK